MTAVAGTVGEVEAAIVKDRELEETGEWQFGGGKEEGRYAVSEGVVLERGGTVGVTMMSRAEQAWSSRSPPVTDTHVIITCEN